MRWQTGCDRGLEIAARAVGADGALDAGADAPPVRAPAGPVVAGDPDLVAVLADMGIDGIAGVWRAGETPEGVPVVPCGVRRRSCVVLGVRASSRCANGSRR